MLRVSKLNHQKSRECESVPDFFVVSNYFFIFAAEFVKSGVMSNEAMTQTIAEYFKTQPVLKAWLFGSYARGEERPDSDVDIMVILDRSKPIGLKFFGMWGELERLLGRQVDLVTENALMPFARESAERDKKLIYERSN